MRRALFAVLLGCAVVAPTQAAIVYQTGFESPTFSTGDLVGQDGWDRADTDGPPAPNVPITVQTGTVAGGTQAVQILNNAGISDESTFAFHTFSPFNPVTAGTPLITVAWDMRVNSGGTTTHDWGLQVYDQNVNMVASGGMGLAGNGQTTAVVETGTSTSQDFIDLTPVGSGPSLNAFHSYLLTLDYALGVYALDIDGVRKGYAPFITGNDGTLGEVDFFENRRATDTAFFDNLVVTAGTGTVPEPASLGLIGVAGAFLLGRRRRTA
jgi:hypothetical protein